MNFFIEFTKKENDNNVDKETLKDKKLLTKHTNKNHHIIQENE